MKFDARQEMYVQFYVGNKRSKLLKEGDAQRAYTSYFQKHQSEKSCIYATGGELHGKLFLGRYEIKDGV